MENTSVFSEQILKRAGCPIHYWTAGPEGAPLVVFTHGLCVDHRSWDPIAPRVAQRYRVLTWDVRGHGKSQPAGVKYSAPVAVEDLLALLDTLGYPAAAFVGHSNGTYIAQELVFRHPERVSCLVMADGTCITWQMTPAEMWLVRVSAGIMRLFPYEYLKRGGLSYGSAKKEVQDYTYDAFSMLSKSGYMDNWEGAALCLHAEPGYKIEKPELLVMGDDDRMGNIKKIMPLWAKRDPNCRFEIIPNARHFAILDQPELFTRLLLEFLEKEMPA